MQLEKGQPEANKARAERIIREWFSEHWPMPDPAATVHVVGLGRTLVDYMRWTMEREPPYAKEDVVWTVNRGLGAIVHHTLWVMDDLPGEADQFPLYGTVLADRDRPFVSSTEYQEYPNARAYPLVEMATWWGGMTTAGYLHNSIPYLLALAPILGATKVVLWGCDYVREDGTVDEYGLANVEYWCGLLRGQGVQVGRPASSTILGGRKPADWIYGYKRNKVPKHMLDSLRALEIPEC